MKKSSIYLRGFKKGYNNPSQFDETKLLKANGELAKGIIAGICQRKQDQQNNCVVFKR